VAHGKNVAGAAVAGQCVVFVLSEFYQLRTLQQFDKRAVGRIPDKVFLVHKMIT
jgi:hypothetical protein